MHWLLPKADIIVACTNIRFMLLLLHSGISKKFNAYVEIGHNFMMHSSHSPRPPAHKDVYSMHLHDCMT